MAAAVADYAPAAPPRRRFTRIRTTLTLTLVRTPDILGGARPAARRRKARPLLVGFAAETSDVIAQARKKQREKGVDLIVANDVSRADAGFEVDTNEVTHRVGRGRRNVPAAVQDRDRRVRSSIASKRSADAHRAPFFDSASCRIPAISWPSI